MSKYKYGRLFIFFKNLGNWIDKEKLCIEMVYHDLISDIIWVVLKIDHLYKDRRVLHRVTTNDNEWQRVTMSGTTSDNEWQRVTTIGTTSDNEWYNEWQWMTTSDNEWYNEWQRVTMSDTTSDNRWQWVTASDSSGTTNENGTAHFKEWLIAILSMTKTDILLLQGMDGCNESG